MEAPLVGVPRSVAGRGEAVAANVATSRALEGGQGHTLGAVLKGNAYGHGFQPMLELLHPLVDVLYVISPNEALAVRGFEAASAAALPTTGHAESPGFSPLALVARAAPVLSSRLPCDSP